MPTLIRNPLLSVFCLFFLAGPSGGKAQENSKLPSNAHDSTLLPPWREGFLDIHHINTGRGNAAFAILPDGTTLLIDAGDMDREAFDKKYFPLKSAPALPSDSFSAAAAIVNYIRQVAPTALVAPTPVIDYALITHFHGDHYGQLTPASPSSQKGRYQLTGLTAVGEVLPIRNLIDRGYPVYDFPTDLRIYYKKAPSSFLNYLAFADQQVTPGLMTAASLVAGRDDQLVLRYNPSAYPGFHIRNIKSNNKIWTGTGVGTTTLFSPADLLDKKGQFSENPLSLAIKISYGKFDYYTGGDNTGRGGEDLPGGSDVETPMAAVIGRVEALSLDHHGNRDANNTLFLRQLAPQVVVAQTWCSDQPGQELAHRLTDGQLPAPGSQPPAAGPDVFYLYMHEETKITLGPWITDAARSLEGHVLIRVSPGGDIFYVYVLDDRSSVLHVKKYLGPYRSQ